MRIIDYLKSLYPINDEIEFVFTTISETKQYDKGAIVFSPGSYLKHVYFVESGFTRIYYNKGKKDVTHYFFGPDTFGTGIESLYYDKPSVFGFQALSDTRITRVPFSAIQELAATDITMNHIIQRILLDSLINFSKRFYNMQFETASERYQSLIAENPALFQKATLGHIASFLGVSQQTLSVIRGLK